MRVKLLPSSAGRQSQFQSLTSFIIDDRLAIDGGSIGFALAPGEIGSIRDIVVTHAHSDHTASLPVYDAEAFPLLEAPIDIHATREVVSALREFVFNDHIWPNFEKIQLGNGSGPGLEFREIEPLAAVNIAGINVMLIPVNHIVPTVGVLAQNETAAVLFTSDTCTTDEIWNVARETEQLKAVFVDVSYPNRLAELAAASKHLTPAMLKTELVKLSRDVEVYAVHIKPTNREDVLRELEELGNRRVSAAEIDRVYEW